MSRIGNRLTRRLMYPILIGIILMYGGVISSMIFVNKASTFMTQEKINELQLEYNLSLFRSKASQISNLFQCFFTDLEMSKRLVQDFNNNTLLQIPQAPTDRSWFEMWFDVLANYDEFADILEESPYNPSEYITYNIGQVRFNNSDFAYTDLAADI